MKKQAWVIAGCVGVLFAAFVWPTLYRYDRLATGAGRSLPVRMNRLTGHTEVLYPSGWVAASGTDNSQATERELSPEELSKIDARGELEGFGSHWNQARITVYNGTNLNLNEITVEITVPSQQITARPYRMTNSYSIHPQKTGIFEAYLGFDLEQYTQWSFRLVAAKIAED